MNIKKLFSYTLLLSIYIQLATLVISLLVITKKTPPEYVIIKDLFFF